MSEEADKPWQQRDIDREEVVTVPISGVPFESKVSDLKYGNEPKGNGWRGKDKRLVQQALRLAYIVDKKRQGWNDFRIAKALGTTALRVRLIIERMTDELMFSVYKDFKAERERVGADVMAAIDKWREVVMNPYKIVFEDVPVEEEDEDGDIVTRYERIPVKVIDPVAIQAFQVWLKAQERLSRLFGLDAPLTVQGHMDVNNLHKFVITHTTQADAIADAVPPEPWQAVAASLPLADARIVEQEPVTSKSVDEAELAATTYQEVTKLVAPEDLQISDDPGPEL